MGLERVLRHIQQETAQKESAILRQAEARAQALGQEAEKKARRLLQEAEEKARHKAAVLQEKALAALELEMRKRLLEEKKKVLEEVMEAARERVQAMPARQRAALLARLVKKGKKELPGAAYYLANARDRALLAKKRTGLKPAGTAPLLGGVVLLTRDRRVRSNQSFEQVLEKVEEAYLAEVANRLFRG